ncbi:MAG: dienelactone hydrolase family protein [Anaerolinea sp.]|nr:dienelactone hydrolase family protein [Anaerolinea sp.]
MSPSNARRRAWKARTTAISGITSSAACPFLAHPARRTVTYRRETATRRWGSQSMNEYQRYLIEEFADEYAENHMSRRDLLRRAFLIMGSVPAGLAALSAVGCGGDDSEEDIKAATQAPSPSPSPDASAAVSPSVAASPAGTGGAVAADIKFAGPGSDLLGYLAKPEKAGTYPGIVVIHENRGLNEHTKDIARRYAKEGFIALAVDLVSRGGGSKSDVAANTGALGSAKIDDLIADMKAYVTYLSRAEGVKTGGVGVTGFCFGGGYAFETAIASPEAKAVVPYYGTCRLLDQLGTTKAAVLAIYGQLDNRVTSQAERVKTELAKSGRPSEVKIYDGANHAFFNDTGGNYNATAAADAWTKTLAWFRQYV